MDDGIVEKIIVAIASAVIGWVLHDIFPWIIRKIKQQKLTHKKNDRDDKKRILELESQIRLFTDYSLKDGVYYNKDGHPFCPSCHAKGLETPLRKRGDSLYCPSCNLFH